MIIKFLRVVGFTAVLGLAGCRSGKSDLDALNNHFIYQGHPVTPRAVEDISEWISDDQPGPVAVDLAGTVGSNRYYGDVWQRDGMAGFDRDEPDSVFGKGMFSYHYCGCLANGCHVLKTVSNDGGTGYFESILLVRFVTGTYFDKNGHAQHRVLMEQAGEYPLGDRVKAKVSVRGNTVEWSTKDSGMQRIRF